ncbi:MAG: ArsR family transcriptional regulator [Thermoplasmata archaeon]|nr:ArsR family transcriptional regulator [Thermoplasmata archaeon]
MGDGIEALEKLPRSAKEVYNLISENRVISREALIQMTDFPERTVRFAIKKLLAMGLIQERISLKDARKKIYGIRHN